MLVHIQITIDTAPLKSTDSVWHDDEDEDIEIDLSKTSRLKKLRKSDLDPTVVSGEVLTNVLQERFVWLLCALDTSRKLCLLLSFLFPNCFLWFATVDCHRFRTRQLEWAKVEDTRTSAIAEDRGFDAEGE